MADHLIRAMLRSHNLRLVVALTTDLCRVAAERHKCSPAASCALGRGLTGGLLMATLSKSDERVTIQLKGSGPLQGVTVDAYGDGLVRGYPHAPLAGAGISMAGRQRLADLVGREGLVNIVRDIGVGDRYQGQTGLVTSEIDEDLESYLRVSEQIPSALGCELVMSEAGEVLGAGGILAQTMPDSPPETMALLRELQHKLRTGELHSLLKSSPRSGQALLELCAGRYHRSLELNDERPLRFQCRCDLGRIEAMLTSLELSDLDEMIEEGKAEITCNYCNEVYELSKDDLLRARTKRQAPHGAPN